MYESMKFEITF